MKGDERGILGFLHPHPPKAPSICQDSHTPGQAAPRTPPPFRKAPPLALLF